jgi:hypothetical protein
VQRALRGCRRRDGGVGTRERRVHAVAGGLHDHAVVLADRVTEDLVVARERGAHRGGIVLPAPGRPLEVGEQERDRPGGQLGHGHTEPQPAPPRLTCDYLVTYLATVTDDDLVFKALADPTRRHLLDRLFERDGRTLTELESDRR